MRNNGVYRIKLNYDTDLEVVGRRIVNNAIRGRDTGSSIPAQNVGMLYYNRAAAIAWITDLISTRLTSLLYYR